MRFAISSSLTPTSGGMLTATGLDACANPSLSAECEILCTAQTNYFCH